MASPGPQVEFDLHAAPLFPGRRPCSSVRAAPARSAVAALRGIKRVSGRWRPCRPPRCARPRRASDCRAVRSGQRSTRGSRRRVMPDERESCELLLLILDGDCCHFEPCSLAGHDPDSDVSSLRNAGEDAPADRRFLSFWEYHRPPPAETNPYLRVFPRTTIVFYTERHVPISSVPRFQRTLRPAARVLRCCLSGDQPRARQIGGSVLQNAGRTRR